MVGIRRDRLESFVKWVDQHITGDEKGEAHIFLDHLLQAFGQPGCLDVGGTPEFRIRKASEDGGGVAFADYVWKPIVLIEMKKERRKERRDSHRKGGTVTYFFSFPRSAWERNAARLRLVEADLAVS